jgi:hypothetical protein
MCPLYRCLTTCACLAGLLVWGVWREWYTVFMQLQFQLLTLELRIPYTTRQIDVKNNEFYKRKVDPCLIRRHAIKTRGNQEEVYPLSLLNGEWPSSRPGRVNTPLLGKNSPLCQLTRRLNGPRQPVWTLCRGEAPTRIPLYTGVLYRCQQKQLPHFPTEHWETDVCNVETLCSLCGKKRVLKYYIWEIQASRS